MNTCNASLSENDKRKNPGIYEPVYLPFSWISIWCDRRAAKCIILIYETRKNLTPTASICFNGHDKSFDISLYHFCRCLFYDQFFLSLTFGFRLENPGFLEILLLIDWCVRLLFSRSVSSTKPLNKRLRYTSSLSLCDSALFVEL